MVLVIIIMWIMMMTWILCSAACLIDVMLRRNCLSFLLFPPFFLWIDKIYFMRFFARYAFVSHENLLSFWWV